MPGPDRVRNGSGGWRVMARIGTWNVENFFRPDAGSPGDEDAYQAKVAHLAETIKTMAPDVLAVQEVGDPEALADLATAVGGPWNLETAGPDGRGIRVGFLSRLPLNEVTQVSAFPGPMRAVQVGDTGPSLNEMGRPALAARVVLDNGRAPGP